MTGDLIRNEPNEADVIRFDVLPDDILLDIFDFYVHLSSDEVETWQTLVHVCRRWRSLVFRSPRRLDLRLVCTPETRTDTLAIWPAFPIIVKGFLNFTSGSGTDNIIAALGQSSRIRRISLFGLLNQQLEQVPAAMQGPFPELTDLELSSHSETPVIPDSFLVGSAPHLRYISFNHIPFPGLPNLILSTPHLVHLEVYSIPPSGYISPEAMVTFLSALSNLKILGLGFEVPQSFPDRETRRPPLSKRSILLALEEFTFNGIPGYLEDLMSRIDTPQLDQLDLFLFDQIDFDFEQLAQFINRALEHKKRDNAYVIFDDWVVRVLLGILQMSIGCREPNRQLSYLAQVLSSSIPSAVEDLYIECEYSELWENDIIENPLWLELLLPFTVTKNLYLAKESVPGIAAALQELVGDSLAGILPNLQNIFVEELEPFEKNIEQFTVARRLSGHPVAISDWKK